MISLLTQEKGVGRVTKPGLTQKIGEAAINPIPRKMIYDNVHREAENFCYAGILNRCDFGSRRERDC